jgi:hypothetical protein
MLKLKKFLFSNKNMTGLGFATVIIVLAMLGLLKAFWFPITMIAYAFGYVVGPAEKTIKFIHMKGENLTDYVGFVEKVKGNISQSSKLPEDAKAVVVSLTTTAVELISFLKDKENFDEYSDDFMSFKNIFDTYLPKLINQYEKLPVKYATQIKTSNGKTAKEMLMEQLKLMDKQVTEISYGMYENDVTALKVNGRFLKQKFSQANLFEMEEVEKEHNG